MEFFVDYVDEPVMVQRLMGGDEFSVDILGDLDGRCLNAIPRTMIESRGGESIKGTVIADPELIDLGRRVGEALGVPGPMYAALPGRTYPELIVRMARGERVEPHVGEFRSGHTFTRWYWQIELDEELRPTDRDIVASGPRSPIAGEEAPARLD